MHCSSKRKDLSLRSRRRLHLEVAKRMAAEQQQSEAEPRDDPQDQPASDCDSSTVSDLELSSESSGDDETAERQSWPVDSSSSQSNDTPTDDGSHKGSSSDSFGSFHSLSSGKSELDSSDTSDETDLCSEGEYSDSSVCEPTEPTSLQPSSPALFPEARVSSHQLDVAFMALSQRHNLTYASQTDLLKLLSILLPTLSNVSSAQTLIRKFVNFRKETVVQHFCGGCNEKLLPGSNCSKATCMRAMHSVMVWIPLAMQLKERFDGK